MKTGDFFAPIFLPGVLFLGSPGTGGGMGKKQLLAIIPLPLIPLPNLLRNERNRSSPIPMPLAMLLPPSWPSFASVPIESRRWSEGEIKAKTQPNQAGWKMEIKVNKSKTKQNKVNQGSLKFFSILESKLLQQGGKAGFRAKAAPPARKRHSNNLLCCSALKSVAKTPQPPLLSPNAITAHGRL